MYIENAIKKFGLQDANSTKTPLPAALHLEKNEVMATIETKTLLQQMIETLIYAAIGNRPDITFAATWLSQYNNNPLDSHLEYAKHVLRYLKGTKEPHMNYVEMESSEMYSNLKLNIPTRNFIRSLCSLYLCKWYHADWWIDNLLQHYY